jgi:hypothetical protein
VTEWRDVDGFVGLYRVSRCGQVLGVRRGRVMKRVRGRDGYLRVNLSRDGRPKHFLVHRLVYAAFRGRIPAGLQVNHIDGDKGNPALDNLELLTPGRTADTPSGPGSADRRAGPGTRTPG